MHWNQPKRLQQAIIHEFRSRSLPNWPRGQSIDNRYRLRHKWKLQSRWSPPRLLMLQWNLQRIRPMWLYLPRIAMTATRPARPCCITRIHRKTWSRCLPAEAAWIGSTSFPALLRFAHRHTSICSFANHLPLTALIRTRSHYVCPTKHHWKSHHFCWMSWESLYSPRLVDCKLHR